MGRRRILISDDDAAEESHINLTPLLDVVFVVLITFMIIAPMLDIDRVHLAPGSSAQGKEKIPLQSDEPLAITVLADNTIRVKNTPIAFSDLRRWVEREKKLHPRASPKLIHDSRAHFGTYQAIKNLLESCGFEEMDVILQPQ